MEPVLSPAPEAADIQMQPSEPGGFPVVYAALVALPDDPRQFCRYNVRQQVGVGLLPDRGAESADGQRAQLLTNRFSVEARDLSLTGLYFISAVPYRVGLHLEVQLAIGKQVLTLPSVVRRLEAPARTEMGMLETAYGCGVQFLQSQMAPAARRVLMRYLVGQAV